jgi:hypothetical protein
MDSSALALNKNCLLHICYHTVIELYREVYICHTRMSPTVIRISWHLCPLFWTPSCSSYWARFSLLMHTKILERAKLCNLTIHNEKYTKYTTISPLQWPHDLRHELSSPIQTLGPTVRKPLETWMSVCLFCVVLCAGNSLATGGFPIQEVLPTV